MKYVEFKPATLLRRFINYIWILEGDRPDDSGIFEKVLPDGSAELIFHLKGSFFCRQHSVISNQSQALVFGQLSSFIELRPPSSYITVGVKFKPNGLSAFTKIPQHELRDTWSDLKDIFPGSDHYITEKLSGTIDLKERVTQVEDYLLSILENTTYSSLRKIDAIDFAIQEIKNSKSETKVEHIAAKLGISIRELERKFQRDVGLSPKYIGKIFRFQNLLRRTESNLNFTELAMEAGYYDQPHFIRDFKNLAGSNPRQVLGEQSPLREIFIDKRG